jgi:hypothetical protein
MVAPRRVGATAIERAPEAGESKYLRVMAAVTNVKENPDGSVRLEVIGVPALLPSDIYRGLRSSRAEFDDAGDEETMGTSLKVFGEYEVKLDYQNNFALDKRAQSDVLHLDQESEFALERGETWVRLSQLFGRNLAVKIGRQNFAEPRQ